MVWRKCEKEKQSYSVVPFTAESEQQFEPGKKDFLREARVLSQFGSWMALCGRGLFLRRIIPHIIVMELY